MKYAFIIDTDMYEICPLCYWPDSLQCRYHGQDCSGKIKKNERSIHCPLLELTNSKIIEYSNGTSLEGK